MTTMAPLPTAPKANADAPEVVRRVQAELVLVDLLATQIGVQLGGKVMHDELVSFGQEGLLAAARSFDEERGVPFRRWASYRIRGAMLDGVRSTSMLPRSVYTRLRAVEAGHHAAELACEEGSAQVVTSAEEADARLGTYLANIATAVTVGLLATATDKHGTDALDPAPTAEEALAQVETLAEVREAMKSLPDAERHLIQRHYFDDIQLDQAAGELGLSKSWGSRIHGRAIEAITRQLKRTRGPRDTF